MKKILIGLFVLILCLPCLHFAHAAEIQQNLNIWFEYKETYTPNRYCSQSYEYQLIMHWSAPPQGNVCFYHIFINGISQYATHSTLFLPFSTSGCWNSYSDFKSWVNDLLKQYYYNKTFKVVAARDCGGLPDIVDQITVGDETSIQNASKPSPIKQNPTPFVVGEPIDVASGNIFTSHTDINISAKEVPLELSRTYNSQDDFNAQFGYGWRSNFDIVLKEYPNLTVVERDDKGVCSIYTKNSDGSYTPSAGKYSVLTKNSDSTYTLLRKQGKILFFDTHGRLIKIQERNGNAINIIRNLNGAISEVNDASGRKLLFTLDFQDRVTQITDPADRILAYAYDASGNLIRVTDPLNNSTVYQYDSNHKLIQKTDANNYSLFFEYDSLGRACRSWQDGNLNEITLSFDPDNSTTTTTDSRGNITKYEYNTYGLVTKITDAQNNIQTFVWDSNLNKTSFTDQNSHTSNFTYDSRGNLLTATDPLNNTTGFTYEPNFDFIKTATDAQGNISTYDYDTKGNLIKLTDALGNFMTNTYDTSGQLTSSTNPNNYTTTLTYDTYGNILTAMDALNNTTTFSYDIVGNRTQIKDAQNNITQYTYDNLNQLTQIKYPDNSTVSYAYDAVGNKTSVTDNASNTTSYAYDLNGKVISVTNPLGKKVNFEYDSEGNRTKATDQNLNQTSYQYDSLNRIIMETNPLGLTKNYTYDAVGNHASFTDAKSDRINYEYDSLNRLTKINYPTGGVLAFSYDALGRRISMTDSQGSTTYAYDKLGRLTQVGGPAQNDTLKYTYDALGNRASLILSDGKTILYAYDALNRIASITDPNNKITTYTYDSVGNPGNITYPNGIQATYTFDALHRLTHLINQNPNNPQGELSEFGYTYDTAGRRSRLVLSGGEIDYAYDASGELIMENKSSGTNSYQISYEYDSAGNRTRMVKNGIEHLYTYNKANQLTQENFSGPATIPISVTGTVTDTNGVQSLTVNGMSATLNGNNFQCPVNLSAGGIDIVVAATDNAGNVATKTIHVTYDNQNNQVLYLYDDNGNLIHKQSSAQTLDLSYDYENRLKSVASASTSITYGYDGDGKRISAANGQNILNYFYDGKDVIIENDDAGVPVTSYLRNPQMAGGIGGIIYSKQGANPETYYSYDGLGSVANLSDPSGANLQSYSYDAFGNMLNQPSSNNSRQFLTKETDSSGFIYFGARYYDPSIGRFITQDPMGMVDGPNMYVYCNNDPVNFIDLWGLCEQNSKKDFFWKPFENYIPNYGNYCGPANTDVTYIKQPTDQMDRGCMYHDMGCENGQGDRSDEADRAILDRLIDLPLNPGAWNPPAPDIGKAIKYRLIAQSYFGIRSGYLTVRDIAKTAIKKTSQAVRNSIYIIRTIYGI